MSTEQLRPHLAPGEAVAWTGRPDPADVARRGLSGAIIIAVACAIFALYGGRFGFHGLILIVPWAFCAGALASPLLAYRRASRSVYAVTDRRALIVTGSRARSFGPGQVGHPTVVPRSSALADVEFAVMRVSSPDQDGGSHSTLRRTGFLAIPSAQGPAAEGALRALLERLARGAAQHGRLRHAVFPFSFVAPAGFTVTSIEPRRPPEEKRGFSLSFTRQIEPSEAGSTDWGVLMLNAPDGASCRVEVRERTERPTLEALSAEMSSGAGLLVGKLRSGTERDLPPFGRGYELILDMPLGIELRQVICFPPGLQLSFTYANQNMTADLYGPFLEAILGSLEAGGSARDQ
jgi:hypothetical protein